MIGALKRLLLVSENLGDLVSIVSNFREHIKSVYELEAFYGEPVLETLLKHAGALLEVLEEFEETETPEDALKVPQKTVFYSGA